MKQNKLFTTLGLARRAGKLTFGFDMVCDALAGTHLVLLSSEVSDRTRRAVERKAQAAGVACVTLEESLSDIGFALGTKPVGVIGLIDAGFAKLIDTQLQHKI